ncbi:MAG TPA: cupin domain-containing protein [Tepidisphaeraceae bacterium]|jgi:quercetin dioxygenase-like cupin family protein|nr:cupin domain-containing protein [Tepidisphaeraceae bacterium]
MKLYILLPLSLLSLSCTQNQAAPEGGEHAKASGAPAAMQHEIIRPEQIQWKDAPPSLPAGAKVAILEGDPAKEGYFAMRVMLPDGYRIPPHFHPGVERVTVISGTFHLGQGEKFDRAAAQALPAGTYSFMQPGMRHFAWAEGPTVLQISTLGPWGITYVNPSDDPRQQK